jgi:hypothetical protein
MSATHSVNSTVPAASVLYDAFELSAGQWKVAWTTARGQRPRLVSVPASTGSDPVIGSCAAPPAFRPGQSRLPDLNARRI